VSLLSSLDHPNIVRYVGTMREGAALLIFLEYVPVRRKRERERERERVGLVLLM